MLPETLADTASRVSAPQRLLEGVLVDSPGSSILNMVHAQAWAQRQLSEASRARCAEDALPAARRSLDGAWPPSGRGGGRGRLWDQEALTL